MDLQKALSFATSVEVQYIQGDFSHFGYEMYCDDQGDPWEWYYIALSTPVLTFQSKYLSLEYKTVHDAVLAHERGHALCCGLNLHLEELDEEVQAWKFAEQHFYEGSKDALYKIRDLSLSTYQGTEGSKEYMVEMFKYFQKRGLVGLMDIMSG